jgi:hypothetical protein
MIWTWPISSSQVCPSLRAASSALLGVPTPVSLSVTRPLTGADKELLLLLLLCCSRLSGVDVNLLASGSCSLMLSLLLLLQPLLAAAKDPSLPMHVLLSPGPLLQLWLLAPTPSAPAPPLHTPGV